MIKSLNRLNHFTMRKNLLLTLMLLLNISIYAQNNSFIVNETFDGTSMPEGWYFIGEGVDNFSISTTNNAGGSANELLFKSSPIVTAGIHLVMATADLTDVEELGLSFKHYLNYDQLSHTLGIATSSDNGTTWNTAWSQTFSNASATGLHEVNETVSTPDMGKSNVLICLYYEGNTYNFNKWYFDNIIIYAKNSDAGNDIQLSSIDVDNVIAIGNTDISFTVNNIGSTEISAFEASYEIEGLGTVTETFNEKIVPAENKTLTFKSEAYLTPGTHTIKINILNVSGEEDSNLDNNSMSKDVRTYIREVERTPMIEHFSSATCINCIPVDTTLSGLTHDNEGRYTYVKYPWDYPMPGDKYYLEECSIRGQYYRVTGVPAISFDGGAITRQPKQSHFDDRYATTSYVDIVGAFNIEGNVVNITADIISYLDMPDVKVFVTVNEKTTVNNVVEGSLPEFHHVLMSIPSSTDGIDASFEAGKYQRYELSVDMTGTNVEEMNDLEVAVWVQTYESKEVHNSHFLNEYTSHPYPIQNLKVEEKTISWEKPEKSEPIGYNVYVDNKLVAEKITENSYTFTSSKDNVLVEVYAVYENGITSVGVCLVAGTGNTEDPEISIEELSSATNIYPNPVKDELTIATELRVEEIAIYDIYGRLCCRDASNASTSTMDTFNVSVQDLENGIYFINIKTDKGNVVRRFIKN